MRLIGNSFHAFPNINKLKCGFYFGRKCEDVIIEVVPSLAGNRRASKYVNSFVAMNNFCRRSLSSEIVNKTSGWSDG